MSLRNKKTFDYSFRVRYSEVDAQRIVYNSHYLTFFDVSIFEFFETIGFDQENYIKKTNFLKTGKKLGNKTENGKLMFIYQAFTAFKVWHGVEPKINNEVIKLLD